MNRRNLLKTLVAAPLLGALPSRPSRKIGSLVNEITVDDGQFFKSFEATCRIIAVQMSVPLELLNAKEPFDAA